MWARVWCSEPFERPRPSFTPPPPPPPPQYRPPPEPSCVATLYALAGNVLDRAKTVLITGGPTVPDVISSEPSARRAMAELTAPGSKPAPAASRNDSWTLSSRAVHWIIAGGVVVAVALVLCVVAVFVRRRRRRRRRPVEPRQQPPAIYHKDGPTRLVLPQAPSEHYFAQQHRPTPPQTSGTFSEAGSDRQHSIDIVTELPAGGSHSYEQLAAATNGFSSDNVIGQGGFGCVYRGRLLDGTEVAIKKLKTESRQGDREFRAEVEIISRVHHRNLVTLAGYCIYSNERLLVYEFVPNMTLDSHLHGNKEPPLDWHQRWKIAVGSARGLAYLHDDCYPKIIHRDVKASNILLDHNFEPKVADFGLAKYQPGDHTHVSTRVMGTFGYIAPEFLSSGKLTDKADVFAFGVVLLELITGRLPVQSSQSYMDDTLVGWARPLLSQATEDGNLDVLLDPRLGSDYDATIMMRMVECAAAAVRQSAHRRPSMVQILKHLQGEMRADDTNCGIRIAVADDSCSFGMDSGESVGPRPRRMQRSQGNTSNDYGSEQAPGDKPNWSTASGW